MAGTARNYLSFRVGPEWYGVGIEYITEVLHLVGLTELPGTSPEILGLLTLRDSVMPVVDLRIRFKLPEAPLTLTTPLIALHTPKGAMAIVVDDVDDVGEFTGVMAYEGEETPYVKGAIKQKDRLLLLLNVERVYRNTKIHEIQAELIGETVAQTEETPIQTIEKPTPKPKEESNEGKPDPAPEPSAESVEAKPRRRRASRRASRSKEPSGAAAEHQPANTGEETQAEKPKSRRRSSRKRQPKTPSE